MPDDKQTRITAHRHDKAERVNIPTAETGSLMRDEQMKPIPVGYPHRNSSRENPEDYVRDEDRDPQLVWKGKHEEDETDLVVAAPPIYVQEKISARFIVENLLRFFRRLKARGPRAVGEQQPLVYEDEHDEIPDPEARVEFYKHSQRWTNRMILGDSLKVMASLAEREGLRGKVQCIFMDPPYGISYKSNWQMRTSSTAVSDRDENQEPEVVRAFRDTWKYRIHSYLSYLRDRMQAARDLLTESGSFFLQIGDDNVHLCRSLLDEVFGKENYITTIKFRTNARKGGTKFMSDAYDYILWFAKSKDSVYATHLYVDKQISEDTLKYFLTPEGKVFDAKAYTPKNGKQCSAKDMTSQGQSGPGEAPFMHEGKPYSGRYSTGRAGLQRLQRAGRLLGGGSLSYIQPVDDAFVSHMDGVWSDTSTPSGKIYVVQTMPKVVQRCMLMTTRPGDLVLDPTCGSGTTAFVAEKHGRRWITIDTSKVALAGARARLMGAKFPCYLLADSLEGARAEERLGGTLPPGPYGGDLRQGFVYERSKLITLGGISGNPEIDLIWERHRGRVESRLDALNQLLAEAWKDWEVPYAPSPEWSEERRAAHEAYWRARGERQAEMDASISQAAENVVLYDRPVEDKKSVRVSGPFTMETLTPYRVLPADEVDFAAKPKSEGDAETPFTEIVREWLASEGVSGTKKEEWLNIHDLKPLASGRHVHFVGRCGADGEEREVAVFVGGEYSTVSSGHIQQAAREASKFCDYLLVLGFAFEAHAAGDDEGELGRVRYRKVRMDQELRMANRLAKGKKHAGNLFTFVGDVDVALRPVEEVEDMWVAEVRGVEVYDFNRHAMRSAEASEIACWLIDTDYNEEAFFVRHAYFPGKLGGKVDPYKSLKVALKAEVNAEAWATLNRTVSRPFKRPESGFIAVKAINHYGDEVLKVCRIPPA